jgi:hypothetical protein
MKSFAIFGLVMFFLTLINAHGYDAQPTYNSQPTYGSPSYASSHGESNVTVGELETEISELETEIDDMSTCPLGQRLSTDCDGNAWCVCDTVRYSYNASLSCLDGYSVVNVTSVDNQNVTCNYNYCNNTGITVVTTNGTVSPFNVTACPEGQTLNVNGTSCCPSPLQILCVINSIRNTVNSTITGCPEYICDVCESNQIVVNNTCVCPRFCPEHIELCIGRTIKNCNHTCAASCPAYCTCDTCPYNQYANVNHTTCLDCPLLTNCTAPKISIPRYNRTTGCNYNTCECRGDCTEVQPLCNATQYKNLTNANPCCDYYTCVDCPAGTHSNPARTQCVCDRPLCARLSVPVVTGLNSTNNCSTYTCCQQTPSLQSIQCVGGSSSKYSCLNTTVTDVTGVNHTCYDCTCRCVNVTAASCVAGTSYFTSFKNCSYCETCPVETCDSGLSPVRTGTNSTTGCPSYTCCRKNERVEIEAGIFGQTACVMNKTFSCSAYNLTFNSTVTKCYDCGCHPCPNVTLPCPFNQTVLTSPGQCPSCGCAPVTCGGLSDYICRYFSQFISQSPLLSPYLYSICPTINDTTCEYSCPDLTAGNVLSTIFGSVNTTTPCNSTVSTNHTTNSYHNEL